MNTIEIPANRKTRRTIKNPTIVVDESTNTEVKYVFVPMKIKVT